MISTPSLQRTLAEETIRTQPEACPFYSHPSPVHVNILCNILKFHIMKSKALETSVPQENSHKDMKLYLLLHPLLSHFDSFCWGESHLECSFTEVFLILCIILLYTAVNMYICDVTLHMKGFPST